MKGGGEGTGRGRDIRLPRNVNTTPLARNGAVTNGLSLRREFGDITSCQGCKCNRTHNNNSSGVHYNQVDTSNPQHLWNWDLQ